MGDSTAFKSSATSGHTEPFLSEEDVCGPILSSTSVARPATDKAWAVAFKINVAVNVISALYFGSAGLQALNEGKSFAGYKPQHISGGDGGGMLAPALFLGVVVCLGWGFAWCLLHVIIRRSQEILQVAYCSSAAISGLAALYALDRGRWFGWIVPAFFCAWAVRVFLKRQSRIIFGSANLKVAALAIKSMPWTIRAALFLSGVQVAWILLSSVAAMGSMASLQTVTTPHGNVYSASACHEVSYGGSGGSRSVSCKCVGDDTGSIVGDDAIFINSPCVFESGRGSFLLGCFWLASIAWGAAVIQNLVTATVTGSVASWWFSPGDKSSVRGALYRATHGSFGSLCKAAAVATVVNLVITTLRRISKFGRCGNVLLHWLRGAVNYALTYAICFISIYGLSFSEAGQRVSGLFRKHAVTTIANDVVVDVGLAALVLAATVVYVVAAVLLLTAMSNIFYGNTHLSAVFVIAVGTIICSYILVTVIVATTLEVLRSAVKAVFVCFVQDPQALAANHERRIYDDLSKAWHEMQAERLSMTSEPEHIGTQYA